MVDITFRDGMFKMMAAIKNRDGDAVEQLVRDHIIKGKNAVLSQLTKEEQKKKSA